MFVGIKGANKVSELLEKFDREIERSPYLIIGLNIAARTSRIDALEAFAHIMKKLRKQLLFNEVLICE